MSQHNPITQYDRFLLACAVNDARHKQDLLALAEAIRNMQNALGLDPVEYNGSRICLIAENIVALG